jgi:hypothetical protein
MKNLLQLFFLLASYSLSAHSDLVVCRLDYYEKITKFGPQTITLRDTAVVISEKPYGQKIGDFFIKITNQNSLQILVSYPQKTMSDIAEIASYDQNFSRSYIYNNSGLKIFCYKSM